MVNKDHSEYEPQNFVTDIPISLGVDNFNVADWDIKTNKDRIEKLSGEFWLGKDDPNRDVFRLIPGAGKIAVEVTNPNHLDGFVEDNNNRDVKYKLTITSPTTGLSKKVDINLTIAAKSSTGKITTKGSIDIANPASAVTATLKPTNTQSQIAFVELYKDAAPSSDFKVSAVSGNTFKIAAAHNEVVPGIQQTLQAKVTLKNGVGLPPINVKVKPVQGKGKASQSLKAVTLYKSTPQYGSAPVKLDLTKPANAKSGVVVVNQASLKAMKFTDGGFRLEQNGANEYSIYFAGTKAPAALDKTGRLTKLKSSYTLKLDIWAENTYTLDPAGNPSPLKDTKGKPMSKPTTVTVKVNIK
jgi:hypothetical protein